MCPPKRTTINQWSISLERAAASPASRCHVYCWGARWWTGPDKNLECRCCHNKTGWPLTSHRHDDTSGGSVRHDNSIQQQKYRVTVGRVQMNWARSVFLSPHRAHDLSTVRCHEKYANYIHTVQFCKSIEQITNYKMSLWVWVTLYSESIQQVNNHTL